MIRSAHRDDGWVWQMFIRREEQPEGCALTEGKRGIPFLVAGVDLNGLTGVQQFKPRPFRLPGTRRGLARQVEGGLQLIQCGLPR
jgi:hypothetical protein